MAKEKKKRGFPSAFTICFIVVLIAAILSWIIPAGNYDTFAYDEDAGQFVVTSAADGSQEYYEATQETLDRFGITAHLDSFLDGTIYKPMAISGTYTEVEASPQGLQDFLYSAIDGMYDAVDIIVFIFMIGGCIGILNYMGAFNAGIGALSKACKGREQIIIFVVTFLIALGGTTFGMCEETIAFYPVLIPIFIAAGYDAITGVAAIYAGSSIGCMFSTVNPFSVVLGSYAAGVSFTNGIVFRLVGLVLGIIIVVVYILKYARRVKADPAKSLSFESREFIEKRFAAADLTNIPEFTVRMKICLVIFLLSFVIMIWGVSSQGWWFGEMAELFLVSGILIGIIGGIGEKAIVREFVNGASELIGVALICGVARAVSLLLDAGNISGTILYGLSSAVAGMPPAIFIILMMLVFVILGFFVNSSSGLALMSIPIMAPLADVVGIPREVVVSAYIYGLGIITFITPTGMILPSLELVDVTYDKWLKFIFPLLGILTVLGIVLLLGQIYLG